MSQINVIHVSDLHYSPNNLEESDRCLLAAIEQAQQCQPDAIVFSGDATDHRLEAHSSALLALASRIKQCADIAPVLILQGTYSHEPPGTIEVFGLLGGKYPIAIANRIGQIALIEGCRWRYSEKAVFNECDLDHLETTAVFTCVPTTNKANLAASLGTDFAADEMGITIQHYLQHAGAMNLAFSAMGIPTVGVSHGTVHGCITEHGVPMMGFDHEFTQEALFDAHCDAFMLGHIHKHQSWHKGGRTIAYPGSIGRFHYGEEGDKGFLLWRIGAGRAECLFHVSPACRMSLFDFDGLPDLELLKAKAPECAGAYVRVRWQIDQEHMQVVSREQVLEILSEAREIKIDIRILKIQRSRAEGINLETSLEKKLEKWAGLTNIDPVPLTERLDVLTNTSAASIAANIISDLQSFETNQQQALAA